ncbi:hypothetical protein FHS82_002048 [Pseudochelatococcus lubricantis]|uniref:Glutamyl-tRNA amidotransferase n=1 Tax=Pseudochelatococcus lubricantis TaxID=1538102 RepID=A0ABX0V528_9HYPH|nr:GatB/YqeY domain-containing protein [Pseudochelatococcus lubricantis]NIJ58206.1 hypothetical protein [Pseudochelatococcus lubricantis]
MRERLTTALKEALRAGDKQRLSTIRLVQAALKDKDIEARGAGRETASEDEILSLLQKLIKQRQESAKIYAEAGRPELAEQETAEAAIIASFLPAQLSEEETAAAIDAAIAETGAAGVKDMGRVVGLLKERFAGRLDFAKASGLVKARLSQG